MEIQQALEIKKALKVLSEYLNVSPQIIAQSIDMFNEGSLSKIARASEKWNEFDNCDIVQRGKMLGFDVEISSQLTKQ